jgi:hypothetical protein
MKVSKLLWRVHKKLKRGSSCPISRYVSKGNKITIPRDTYISLLIAALFHIDQDRE